MVFTREDLFLLGLCFSQKGDTAFENLAPLLERLLGEILRCGFLSRLGQIDDCFGVSDSGVFIRFQIFTGRSERFDEQILGFGVELLQDASIGRSR